MERVLSNMSDAMVCLSTQTVTCLPDDSEDIEIVANIITIPPHTKLSRQWYPGEEFAYVLDGFVVLHQEDKPDEFYKKGDVGNVPFAQVHNVSTQEEGAIILVFRIHEPGKHEQALIK
jgi:quercetin dioxygenase-like cupin family protein